ncbi:MAG: thioredoxin domain-containing protein, partial [Actinobacteria bacterium]|nr:thioredoxin domain-containing protein [Actinomycetota bacterium]
DDKNGGFFLTETDSSDIPVRGKVIYDGALPSGNSVAMLNMLRLSRLIGDNKLEEKAHEISKVFNKNIIRSPASCPQMMSALGFMFGPVFEVVIVGDSNSIDTKMMLDMLSKKCLPNLVVLFIPSEKKEHEITNIAKFTKDMRAINGKTTAYVCMKFNCELPTTDINEIRNFLQIKSG